MTSAEKSAMRFRIQQETAPSSSAPISTPSPYVWMFAPRSLAMLGVALLVIFSTGSAYASEGSLPGSPLYPVKTKIVEPLKVALAPTVQAKAQANADIASARVQEAQTMSGQGTLTPKVVQEISESYNAHAKAALALVADIDSEDTGDDEDDSPVSNQDTGVAVTVAVSASSDEDSDDMAPDTAVVATMMAEPVEPAEPASSDSDSDDGDVAITATAPTMLSISIQTTSSKDIEEVPPSAPTARSAKTVGTYSTSQKSASTTRATEPTQAPSVAVKATSTATTTVKQNNSRSFVRTLRASLSAQAEILQQLDAEVRLGKGGKGDN